jgi:hypothetical protein
MELSRSPVHTLGDQVLPTQLIRVLSSNNNAGQVDIIRWGELDIQSDIPITQAINPATSCLDGRPAGLVRDVIQKTPFRFFT